MAETASGPAGLVAAVFRLGVTVLPPGGQSPGTVAVALTLISE